MTNLYISQEYVETVTIPSGPVISISQGYVEATTKPTGPIISISQEYLEVLTPVRRQFIGWGLPA